MREGTWEYAVTARCALADAISLMSDVERLGEVHPLVTKVAPVPAAPLALRSYEVTDKLRWGPLRLPITYHADVMAVSELEVVTAARQRPRTSLWITSQFQVDGERVHIRVSVKMRAPTLLFLYAYRTGKAAHLELAERIREVLER
ncbi:MAG: SRPBCC family protein [Actinomycetota bacterium]|nr:SRPBCC family protein [Actinomycetota bacterium]